MVSNGQLTGGAVDELDAAFAKFRREYFLQSVDEYRKCFAHGLWRAARLCREDAADMLQDMGGLASPW